MSDTPDADPNTTKGAEPETPAVAAPAGSGGVVKGAVMPVAEAVVGGVVTAAVGAVAQKVTKKP